MKRKLFVASSASVAALFSLFPERLIGAPARIYTRLEVNDFAKDAKLVKAFRDGVKAMRAHTECKAPGWSNCPDSSWEFWHNSHWMSSGSPPAPFKTLWNQCPHHKAYFYAWHRGFVYFFEKKVRELSGNDDFALPYWDYYKNPTMPKIFTDKTLPDGTANPLYWDNRKNTTVSGLTLNAYSPKLTDFPFGFTNPFEPAAEANPHDQVHGVIGGSMGSVNTAALDPVFWVHHSNIDRLWSAWLNAGGGRKMPPNSSPWWKPAWTWNSAGTWKLAVAQMDISTALGYTFADLTLPTKVSAVLPTAPPVVVTGKANASGPIVLGRRNVTVSIPIASVDQPRLRALSAGASASQVTVILDDVELTPLGKEGGFAFNVYLNLPTSSLAQTAETDERYFVGSVNSFTISTMQAMAHGAVSLKFSASLALADQARIGKLNAKDIHVSFVGFGAPEHANGSDQFVKIGRIRIVTAEK